ncbi:15-hydroxyprostaglandin dehydrogenase [NAD(+)]-like [Trichogramma pretiosum]|uniref:15-hydroxyprostaglandin dehydrogenase [NAD(+)]-like n=1 Tax=Trichogramma pretiosum TaxID=7493 RepID=UPI0006C96CB8|nr:15-hydroxyprostaglandin dehydrogenase [NAD(+)]-like [Trichogramma pretiosum]XP_023313845.1 15-hydroxyprostaglandin dehydrogenase [NAD(+)]-like [Trichogramma pretiosum]
MDVKGRVVLVTAGAGGIGRCYAEELVNQGAKVSICDINTEEGEKVFRSLASRHGKDRVLFCPCDVTDYPQFEDAFKTTIAHFGHIDIVINNAGIMNDRLWELEVDINLNGVIRGTLLAQRYMGIDKGGRGGVVVNTGSNVGFNPYVSVPIYSATKAAIVSFTRAFGDQYHVGLTGVRMITICPGATKSNLVRADVGKQLLSPRYEDAWRRDTANANSQTGEHVAKALINILANAKSGSVWLVENGQPAKEITFSKS